MKMLYDVIPYWGEEPDEQTQGRDAGLPRTARLRRRLDGRGGGDPEGQGDPSPEGRVEQQMALYSTVHGAGRVLSRSRPRGKVDRRTGELLRPPEVTSDMLRQSVAEASVTLRGAGVDESPHCYKRLSEVLREHAKTIEIVHRLKPIGVAMAGPEIFDPYKD